MPWTLQTVHGELFGVMLKQHMDYSQSHTVGTHTIGQPVPQQKGLYHELQLSHARQDAQVMARQWVFRVPRVPVV